MAVELTIKSPPSADRPVTEVIYIEDVNVVNTADFGGGGGGTVGGATEVKQDTIITSLGAPADAEATTDGSIIGVLKRIRTFLTNISTTNANLLSVTGNTTDAETSGNGTVIQILKRIRTLLETVPVTGPVTNTELRAAPVEVTGTITASGPVTNTQLRASPVPVSGTLTVTNIGEVTDLQSDNILRPDGNVIQQLKGVRFNAEKLASDSFLNRFAFGNAADVESSGDGSMIALLKRIRTLLGGTLAVSGPVTDAQLRASAVPVSGPLTDAQLRATVVPVAINDVSASGTLTAANVNLFTGVATANSTVEIDTNGASKVAVQLTGTFSATGWLQGTVNGTTWVQVLAVSRTTSGNSSGNLNAAGVYTAPAAGFTKMRVTLSSFTSGSVGATIRAATGSDNDQYAIASGRPQVDITNAAGNSLQSPGFSGGFAIGGAGAHSQAVNGNPVRAGSKVSTTVDTTLVSGDTCDLLATDSGALIVKPFASPPQDWLYTGTITTATTTTLKTFATGQRQYITGIQFINTSATATKMTFSDGGGGTTLFTITARANMVTPASFPFNTPLRPNSAGSTLQVVTSAAGTVDLNVQGFTAL